MCPSFSCPRFLANRYTRYPRIPPTMPPARTWIDVSGPIPRTAVLPMAAPIPAANPVIQGEVLDCGFDPSGASGEVIGVFLGDAEGARQLLPGEPDLPAGRRG